MSKISKKNKIISAIVALIMAIFGVGSAVVFSGAGGGQMTIGPMNVAGTAGNAISMPIVYVDAASTSTAGVVAGDGGDIVQDINVDGINEIRISGILVPSRTTSTLSIMPEISLDGTTFFPLTATSTATDVAGTSTIAISPLVWVLTPGVVASTSFSMTAEIPSAKTLRLKYLRASSTEDTTQDMQAFIQISGEQGF